MIACGNDRLSSAVFPLKPEKMLIGMGRLLQRVGVLPIKVTMLSPVILTPAASSTANVRADASYISNRDELCGQTTRQIHIANTVR